MKRIVEGLSRFQVVVNSGLNDSTNQWNKHLIFQFWRVWQWKHMHRAVWVTEKLQEQGDVVFFTWSSQTKNKSLCNSLMGFHFLTHAYIHCMWRKLHLFPKPYQQCLNYYYLQREYEKDQRYENVSNFNT